MISTLTTLLFAAAIALPPTAPKHRLPARRPERTKNPRDGPQGFNLNRCASDLRLFAACAQAGLPPPHAAAAVADTYAGEAHPWHTTAALLALGAEPERAWSELASVPGGADLASLVTLSNSSGTSLSAGCVRIAERLQAEAADRATAKAERAGVLIAIPLTAFFLPAFFTLGLAPVVISLGSEMLN
ncbi:Bacterial type II secretion system protein F domain protein [Corynebacterium glaucum]|uniref:Bacterial type II secretion system protein F domain protein n=1 Tax=Corynebacterium glaucum TaxID=187491 RepID=A0A1Q2HTL0_9CORY|nr:type II secretion system F family protein [Corynebacterium glaucum]AQQ14173.1 Bacterial type II secretion system protein F domain protein [Corynebacterium glaucum]WJZ06695.1 Bacterial type II secretion system protein F domain protein [Corynebacterium glaucum]